MGRPLRIEYPGALYHITSRGNEKKKIFLDDGDCVRFLKILEDYHDRYGILIHSYVLMDNHYHLILETPRGNLLKVMHGLNGGYTGYFNRKYGRVGHLFQGRYRGIMVEKDRYLLSLSRYLHLNPFRARVVERPEHYRWSSYPGYIGKVEEDWVEYSWVLSQFGKDMISSREKYQDYIEEALEHRVESPMMNLESQAVLGGEEFIEKTKRMLKGISLSNEIVERKRFVETPSPEDVIRAVAKAFGVKEEEIRNKSWRRSMARRVAIYLVQRYTGLGNEKVGELFGGIHYSAVSKASARLREEMVTDRRLLSIVNELNSHFKT
ncbi:MAG: Chromosomal replication initiator protein DnaA [candidate division WS2 bacterium]|nr:Chromosomal replication initiator protein DnaA [Candidatus Lithacetigena glycinireducens]